MRSLLRRWRPAPPAEHQPDRHEREILAALTALRDTSVREVMTSRVDVVALPAPVTAAAVSRAVKESGHSRFPVYDGDLDHLLGVLFVKDLFRMGEVPTPEAVARRLREPFVVSETARVLDVLSEMREGRHAFALVIDEHGGIEGVLTVKDLVSELVGDLRDEFDRPEAAEITRVDATRWLVGGHVSVDRLTEAVGLDVGDGEYVTVAGFLLHKLGRIPVEGDAVEHDGWELRVAEMDRRRVAKVVVRSPSGTIGATGK